MSVSSPDDCNILIIDDINNRTSTIIPTTTTTITNSITANRTGGNRLSRSESDLLDADDDWNKEKNLRKNVNCGIGGVGGGGGSGVSGVNESNQRIDHPLNSSSSLRNIGTINRQITSSDTVRIPIIGYEVMEERERFTVSIYLFFIYLGVE